MELTLDRPNAITIPLKIIRVSLLFLLLLFAFPFLTSLAEGPSTAPAADPFAATEQALLARINEIRGQYGLAPVAWNGLLGQAADAHVYDMQSNGNRSHYGTDGSNYRQRVARTGYQASSVNEAIGWGYNMERQITWWMNSPVHRGIILSAQYTEIGIGYRGGGRSGNWWVMNFASR